MLEGQKILVAEDNPLNQKIAVFLLTKHGADITTVANGAEAIRLVEATRFDLVLMDIQMPEMDGYEATQYIRHTLKSNVPILALSASNYEDEIAKCLSIGMNGCISKPIDADKLFDAIRRITKEFNITA
ncbi:hypothetical protein GCM10023093_04030 [Nemorincola caseinilytica]|uniref:Response regulatory domain-containing protein n=1 Tax=Nemorincola caseinilytica TaxID=2054315 RepID=A0ABP8N3P0_9BACT